MKKVAHAMTLKQIKSDWVSTYHTAFSCFLAAKNYYFKESTRKSPKNESRSTQKEFQSVSIKNKSYRDDISSESTNYGQMLKHLHSSRFKQIIQIEINQLRLINVWKEVQIKNAAEKHSISIIWVFKYKFDEKKYLVKYEAKLCVRENMQRTDQNIYTIILVIRIFRVFIIMIATFDLKTRQYAAINVSINSEIDESIYCILSQR